MIERFEGKIIGQMKRPRAKKLNIVTVKATEEDEEDSMYNVKLRPGYLQRFATTNKLSFEVCVACYLDWKRKIIEERVPIPKHLLYEFLFAKTKAPSMPSRNHKERGYTDPLSDRKCCNSDDRRILYVDLPWIREFAPDSEASNQKHAGIFSH